MITFSKRRSGIHKKASELVTLTGAEIGIVCSHHLGSLSHSGIPPQKPLRTRSIRMRTLICWLSSPLGEN
ncbi:hypothetical protein CUMW_237430 [Citrus unshiu]|uniref:MADS-box domain-containing protein n=1 Tax=Citrus unshiu TaxID=55188 RepID=A0A2H5QK26_CITUN|nr:hypothetical protein CUMW_237430 [Citrus unshiu]